MKTCKPLLLVGVVSLILSGCATTNTPAAKTSIATSAANAPKQAALSETKVSTPAVSEVQSNSAPKQTADLVSPTSEAVVANSAATTTCQNLYTNYDSAMANLVPKKKKKSLFSKTLGAVASNAGVLGVGMLSNGVDVKTVQTFGKASNMINNANTANELNTLMGASSIIDVNRTAYRLAMENNCDINELNTITKKYGG